MTPDSQRAGSLRLWRQAWDYGHGAVGENSCSICQEIARKCGYGKLRHVQNMALSIFIDRTGFVSD